MELSASIERALALLSIILEYPGQGVQTAIEECQDLLAKECPEAAVFFESFEAAARGLPLEQLEEVFASTFDMDTHYYPYLGYHLFGETYKRSIFMLELKERYRSQGFPVAERELPDHISIVLRFLATGKGTSLKDELAREALLPSLDKMLKKPAEEAGIAENPGTPYRHVLMAVQALMEQTVSASRAEVQVVSPGGAHG